MFLDFNKIKDFKYRVIFSLLLLLIGILILAIGFSKTLFLIFCTLLGYIIGLILDKKIFWNFLDKVKEIFYIGRE